MDQKTLFGIGIITVGALAAYIIFKNAKKKSNNTPSFVIATADWDKKKAIVVDENNNSAVVVALGTSIDLGNGYSSEMNNAEVVIKSGGQVIKSLKK